MNGDTYSSRGTFSPIPLALITANFGFTDAGRHGSSRDYPVRLTLSWSSGTSANYISKPPRRDRDDRRDRGGGDRTDRSDRAPVGDRSDRATVRRRSRSPDYRSSGAAGRSRREEGDVDTYSSSRTHRDREREDRYSGRDRRGPERGAERAPDRGAERGAERGADRPERGPDRDRERERDWDRDRGAGRSRRDHDDGGRRRDRDVVDDRRAPRGGMDREFERERERRRSASPPPKKREPTPDLTDVVPILERKRRLTQWDIKPPGYDNVTAEQAKLSGMFPLPGAPRQQTMDPTKLQALMTQPSANSTTSSLLKPTNARQSKRLIVKNLPPSATEESVLNFFNLQLNGLNVIESTDPCALCQIAPDHSFAMLEFRNSGDATVALALDGIMMEADDSGANANTAGGMPEGLNIRRPKDYIVPAIVDDPNYDPDSPTPSSVVLDTPNKISLANIPIIFNEDQVLELAIAFGKVKSFVLVKDNGTDESRVSLPYISVLFAFDLQLLIND